MSSDQRSLVSRLKHNIIANYAGVGWVSLLSLIFVPLYLHMLGAEAYGLVGFFIAFKAVIGALDLGLSTSASREVAYVAGRSSRGDDAGRLVRTFETVYWVVGTVLGVALIVAAPAMGDHWFRLDRLSAETATAATIVFALTLTVSWPVALYRGVLRGIERQVEYNLIMVSAATVRGVGSVLVLLLIANTVVVFLVWQLVTAIAEVGLMAIFAWRYLGKTGVARVRRFDLSVLRTTWRFLAGVGGVTIIGIVLAQSDRLVLSRLLPLEHLGYYTVAATLAGAIGRTVGPVITAVFPRLTTTYAAEDGDQLWGTYSRSAQIVDFVVAPVGVGLALFAYDVLRAWTWSAEVAGQAHVALSLLALGYMFNSMSHLASTMQYAAGKVRFLLVYGAISLVVFLPLLYLAVIRWGIVGAAGCWLALNIVSYLVLPAMTHRHIFRSEIREIPVAARLRFILECALLMGAARLLGEAIGATTVVNLLLAAFATGLYVVIHYWQHRDEVHRAFRSLWHGRVARLAP